MLSTDPDALACDLAQTYQIYNYRSLPARVVATFSIGLGNDSRIRMKLRGDNHPLNTLILGMIADCLSWIQWSMTDDGAKNRNKPKSIVSYLTGDDQEENENMVFDSPEEFCELRRSILEGG